MEAAARITAEDAGAPRRSGGVLTLGNLLIDLDIFEAYVDGVPLELSRRDFDLLVLLAHHLDRIVSFEEMYQELWHSTSRQPSSTLAVAVWRLRSKMAGSRPYQVRSARGRGYGLISSQKHARHD